MKFENVKLDYSDVMLVPKCGDVSSRLLVNLTNDDGVTPIIAANMDGVGTFEMAKEMAKYNMMTALHKHYSIQELVEFYENNSNITEHYVIYSMGANNEDFTKFQVVYTHLKQSLRQPKTVCIDVANGYTKATADFIIQVKNWTEYSVKIIAGNVVTQEGVFHLAKAGADIIKVGIGPGSVCTTRRLTGIGYPQFSAVVECVEASDAYSATLPFPTLKHGPRPSGPKIIADGGITSPGDIAKAIAAGADYVMLGGMLAGHDEGGGERIERHLGSGQYETTHMKFYGMASKMAQHLHNGGVKDYRASEGKEVLVPYRGPLRHTLLEILGGLRSSCTYQGEINLMDTAKNPKFIRVNNQLNNVFGS